MKSFRTLKKNAKALSPVVASIILIAVTVAVSVVVAAWMGGMSIGMMGNAEQATISNVYFTPGGASIVATISNTGASNVNFTAAYVSGIVPTTVTPGLASSNAGVGPKGTNSYTLTTPWVSGTTYDIKFTTTKGNNIQTTVTAP
jgi:archaeal type IV pilus assembly protein PilA